MPSDVRRDTAHILGMEALAKSSRALGLQVLCFPSFDPECGFTLSSRSGEWVLDVSSAQRSIWAHLNARKGAPGFGAQSWVEPAVANESLKLAPDVVQRIASVERELKAWTPTRSGIGIDGMPVVLELVGEEGNRTMELWFPSDADSAPGRLVTLLWDVVLRHCTWDATRTAVSALRRYC